MVRSPWSVVGRCYTVDARGRLRNSYLLFGIPSAVPFLPLLCVASMEPLPYPAPHSPLGMKHSPGLGKPKWLMTSRRLEARRGCKNKFPTTNKCTSSWKLLRDLHAIMMPSCKRDPQLDPPHPHYCASFPLLCLPSLYSISWAFSLIWSLSEPRPGPCGSGRADLLLPLPFPSPPRSPPSLLSCLLSSFHTSTPWVRRSMGL